jgi:hypothetical protein
MFAPWWAYTVPRFSHPVVLSDQLGVTLAAANCAQTYSGRLIGYWTEDCAAAVRTSEKGDPSARDAQLERAGLRYAEHHAGRVPVVVAARLGRAFGVFKPAQQIDLEWSVLGRPRLPSDIGLAIYYALVALAIPGFVVLRGRGLPIAPLLLVAAEVVLVTAAVFGQTRYRVPLDVVLVMAAAATVDRVLPGRGAHARRRRGAAVPVRVPIVPATVAELVAVGGIVAEPDPVGSAAVRAAPVEGPPPPPFALPLEPAAAPPLEPAAAPPRGAPVGDEVFVRRVSRRSPTR